MVWQLVLVVVLLARCGGAAGSGPLVAERLPVVVRASETVEGRGRLYRSRRARDRAADALRTSTLQRVLPRLGLGPNAEPMPTVVQAVAAPERHRTRWRSPTRFTGRRRPPTPTWSTLARALDDIERQVAQS